MIDAIYGNFKAVFDMTWPMLLISTILVTSVRVSYLSKHKEKFILYKEALLLLFMLYILSLFQVVTSQDMNVVNGHNLIPFAEIFRYKLGDRLFIKNVMGNVLLFMPYGFFASLFAETKKMCHAIILIASASVLIELTQMAIGRIFDVDDIILNVIGGMFGYYIYISLDKIGGLAPNVFKSKVFLNIITTLILIGVLVTMIMWAVV